jgi:ribA/ribD-fused uncharacterized protein
MTDVIDSFSGEHYFLSNFYESPMNVRLGDDDVTLRAPTVEHAFQAAKTHDSDQALAVLRAPTPAQAKRLGRRVTLREDWDDIKVAVMLACLREKFSPGSDLSLALLRTRPAWLVEGNTWGDLYWGQVDGRGTNMLGRLLMLVRAELDVWIAAGSAPNAAVVSS